MGERERVSACQGMKDSMLFWKRGEKTRSKSRYSSIRGKLTVNNTPSYIREPILVPGPAGWVDAEGLLWEQQ